VEEEIDEELVEGGECFEAIEALGIEAELEGDGAEELVGIEDGIEDERGGVGIAEFLQHGAADGGFAAADFAGELDEAFAFTDAVEEMIVSFAVAGAVEEETRIGSQIEGWLAQSVEIQIHGRHLDRKHGGGKENREREHLRV
jgi:hypothetical protein